MKVHYLLALFLISFIVLIFLAEVIDINDESFMVISNLLTFIVIPAVFFGYYFRKDASISKLEIYFQGVGIWLPAIFAIVIVSITLSLGSSWLILYLIEPVFPSLIDFLMTEESMPTNSFYLGFEIFLLILLGPIVEEFIFRGVFLHRFIKKTSTWGGVFISSFLFGILHADIIGAFLFGIIASLLYLRTRNLLIPIIMHILNNTVAFIALSLPTSWFDRIVVETRNDII